MLLVTHSPENWVHRTAAYQCTSRLTRLVERTDQGLNSNEGIYAVENYNLVMYQSISFTTTSYE